MTKCYDIDPITELTATERSEIQVGLDGRATRMLRNLALATGRYDPDSDAVKAELRDLGVVVNAYRKVCGGGDAFEGWIGSFNERDGLRLRVALRNRPEN